LYEKSPSGDQARRKQARKRGLLVANEHSDGAGLLACFQRSMIVA
jgi:hypothetical protein